MAARKCSSRPEADRTGAGRRRRRSTARSDRISSIRLSDRSHLLVTPARAALLSLDFDLARLARGRHHADAGRSHGATLYRRRGDARRGEGAAAARRSRATSMLPPAPTARPATLASTRRQPRPCHRAHHGPDELRDRRQTYTGAAGFERSAQQPAGTLTVAFGTLAVLNSEFTAAIVHAGDSVERRTHRCRARQHRRAQRQPVDRQRRLRGAPRSHRALPSHGDRAARRPRPRF